LQDEVLSLVRASDATVIFVTHDLEEAIYLGDASSACRPIPADRYRTQDHLPRRRDQLTTRENPEFLRLRANCSIHQGFRGMIRNASKRSCFRSRPSRCLRYGLAHSPAK